MWAGGGRCLKATARCRFASASTGCGDARISVDPSTNMVRAPKKPQCKKKSSRRSIRHERMHGGNGRWLAPHAACGGEISAESRRSSSIQPFPFRQLGRVKKSGVAVIAAAVNPIGHNREREGEQHSAGWASKKKRASQQMVSEWGTRGATKGKKIGFVQRSSTVRMRGCPVLPYSKFKQQVPGRHRLNHPRYRAG